MGGRVGGGLRERGGYVSYEIPNGIGDDLRRGHGPEAARVVCDRGAADESAAILNSLAHGRASEGRKQRRHRAPPPTPMGRAPLLLRA